MNFPAHPSSALALVWLALACASPPPTKSAGATQRAPTVVIAPAPSQVQPEPTVPKGRSCGALECLSFDHAEDAIDYVVTLKRPRVLAVGEIHVQRDLTLKSSTTKRFAELVPRFKGRAKHLVIELWTGRNDCGDKRVEKVQEAQKPVTSAQNATNQNDFVALGTVAKSNGITPHALVPTCEDYAQILAAQSDDIAKMLELTATKTVEVVNGLLTHDNGTSSEPFIISYGGAMHNDVSPRPGLESFSFASKLIESTQGRYVELDLIQREQVRDSESFTRQAWYPYFRAETLEKHYTLYQTGPSSFALIFPQQEDLP